MEQLLDNLYHKYTHELLHHFTCGQCSGWWTYATLAPFDKWPLPDGCRMYCPHCGHKDWVKPKEKGELK